MHDLVVLKHQGQTAGGCNATEGTCVFMPATKCWQKYAMYNGPILSKQKSLWDATEGTCVLTASTVGVYHVQ